MHESDIGSYTDHHADVAGRFLAAGGVNVIPCYRILIQAEASPRGQRRLLRLLSGTSGGMGVDRGLDRPVGRTQLRGLKDSA